MPGPVNTGNTAFLLISAALVFLMTPGLALFYAGLVVKGKDVREITLQVLLSVSVVAIIWALFGFSLVFGNDVAGVIGDLSLGGLNAVGRQPSPSFAPTVPFLAYFSYEVMFAIITPALITGAFADRLDFGRYLLFLIGFSIFIYLPVAHWVWGGGFLERLGVLDFAGGIVVHGTAGTAALTAAILARKSRAQAQERPPSRSTESVIAVALGASLLWFGWFGFNAGSAFAADGVAATAFANTLIAPSLALITWAVIDWSKRHEVDLVSMMTGAVAGLATITPAAGYVAPWGAAIIGAVGGIVTYLAVQFRKARGWDDALDVWGVHGVGGLSGAILVGFLAVAAVNQASGLVEGNARQLAVQAAAVAIAAAYSFVVALAILAIIGRAWRARQR